MKKLNLFMSLIPATILLVITSCLPDLVNAQEKGNYTDIRDHRVYTWVKAGNQTWLAENLKYAANPESWVYNDDTSNLAYFGRLYSWKSAQTACPKGWHLPSDKEWGTLLQSLGGAEEAGLKMQAWDTIARIKNTSAAPNINTLSTLFGGVRHADGTSTGINSWGGCWTSNKTNETESRNVLFVHGSKATGMSTNDNKAGFSVRCIRNK